ncbi:MAG: transaldolase [Pantoea sp. Brub]|nr:transaldolase [Pantoea sp. Brub]
MNQLECLKQFTTVVADTSDIQFIKKYNIQHSTTNPSLILQAFNFHIYKHLVDDAINFAKKQGGTKEKKIINASDKLSVNIGIEILKNISGTVSTEIDVRLSFNKNKCIDKARKIIDLYKEHDIDHSRVLIKLASTWEGIQAAKELEKDGIRCNLTLIFSFAQARACAEANVFLISPFVGRIYDWYNIHSTIKPYLVEKDPGVKSVYNIYYYYKQHSYNTIIMGASFRKIEQIIALSGCDYLTISPVFLEQLQHNNTPIYCQLKYAKEKLPKPLELTEDEFRWEHNQNLMAVEKLSTGICQFAIDQNKLEIELSRKL